jgi:hypothetical protein
MTQHYDDANQRGFWESEISKCLGKPSPVVQDIADVLLNAGSLMRKRPQDFSAQFEFKKHATLDQRKVILPAVYSSDVRKALSNAAPESTSTIELARVLSPDELAKLPPGPCAPFRLGSNKLIENSTRVADHDFWFRLVINSKRQTNPS